VFEHEGQRVCNVPLALAFGRFGCVDDASAALALDSLGLGPGLVAVTAGVWLASSCSSLAFLTAAAPLG
jgi:hypothetical protein